MTLQAIVFDFDGVILESLDVKTRAFLELFADVPEHHEAIARLHLEHAGVSRFEKFRRIFAEMLGRPLDEAASVRLGEEFSAIVYREILDCPFVPGAREFLADAAARYALFVASGTPQDELCDIVERRGLAPFFESVHGTPAGKAEIVARILAERGLAPAECVFIGDAAADQEAALEVGVAFVGRVPPGEKPLFDPAGAVLVVADLAELRLRWAEVEAAAPTARAGT